MKRKLTPKRYEWDDERGVVAIGERGNSKQAMQLLLGPASHNFRRKCGLLLVDALNADAARRLKP